MSRTLQYELKIDDGKSLNTISALEEHVAILRENIKGVDRDSAAFKSMQKELTNADAQLKNVNKSIEGLDFDTIAGEAGKFAGGIGAITASFVLLGGEGNKTMEELQKSMNKALGLMMAFKGGVEVFTSLKKLMPIITDGFKALNNVIKANPILFIVAGVIALTASVTVMLGVFKKQKNAFDELYEKQKDVINQETNFVGKLEMSRAQMKKNEIGTREYKDAVDDYNTTAKEKNLLLIDANADEMTSNAIIEINMKQIKKRALLKSLENQLQQNYNELLANTIELQMNIENMSWKEVATLLHRNDVIKESEELLLNSIDMLTADMKNTEDLIKLQAENDARKKKNAEDEEKRLKGLKTNQNNYTKSVEKTTAANKDLEKSINDLIEASSLLDDDEGIYLDKSNAIIYLTKLTSDYIATTNDGLLKESANRVLVKDTWEEQYELMIKYYEEGILNEDEFNKLTIAGAQNFLDANEMAYEQGLILYEEYIQNIENINKNKKSPLAEWLKISDDEAKELFDAAFDIANTIADAILTIKKNQLDQQFEMQEENLNASMERELENAGDNEDAQEAIKKKYAAKEEELKKQKAKKDKEMAISQALISGALAIVETWAAYAILGPAGLVPAGIQTAFIAATTAAQVAVISSQQFGKGGILDGPSHANGGILTPFGVLEGGEAVINKSATKKFSPILSAINQSTGGNSFGGGSNGSFIDYDLLASKINDKKVYIVSHEMSKQQGLDIKIKERATI